MRYLEYLKTYHNFDNYLLFLDDLGFSVDEIVTMTGSSRQTVYNARDRQKWLVDALRGLTSENKQYGSQDINTIVNTFKECYQTTKITKYDRWAAKRLSDKHGADNIANVIRLLVVSHDRFKPVINSVSQLEEKWPSIVNFFKNKANGLPINPNE